MKQIFVEKLEVGILNSD